MEGRGEEEGRNSRKWDKIEVCPCCHSIKGIPLLLGTLWSCLLLGLQLVGQSVVFPGPFCKSPDSTAEH